MLLSYLVFISFFFSVFIMSLAFFLSFKDKQELEKPSPFECGFIPMINNWSPFSMHFFMSALIFLIFDIELVLLFPSLVMIELKMSIFSMLSAMLFLGILTLGFLIEWNQKFLEWSK